MTPQTPTQYRPILNEIWPHAVEQVWTNNTQYMMIYNRVRLTAVPNHMGARIPIVSGLNIAEWRRMLNGYHDACIVDYLEYGWPVDYTATTPPTTTIKNHSHEPLKLQAIREYVEKELQHGAMLSPFDQPPSAPWA